MSRVLELTGNVTRLMRLKLRLFGKVKVEKKVLRRGAPPTQLFIVRCPEHGLFKDYLHGYRKYFSCPDCD